MPKRGHKQASETDPLSPRMRRHLGRLGVRSAADYAKWCRAHGFAARRSKSPYDLEEELQALAQDRARAAAQMRLHANPRKLIEAACAGDIDADEITRPQLQTFCRAIQASAPDAASRKALCKLLLKVNDEADFLLEGASLGGISYRYVDALINLNERRWQWIAALEDWRPASHNARKQFSALARHLMTRYPVPAFMDQAWFRRDTGSDRYREWFVHVGAGKNIRTLDTPIPFSKLTAHHFLQAPDDYSIEGAIRWGQVHALGGGARLTSALLGTRIGQDFSNNEFWASVIRFFVANPLLDRRHVGPIVDYLYAQKFETREMVVGPGRVEVHLPPQPGLTMRGRTANTLLAQVERWHRELGRASGAERLYFRRSGVKELSLKVGKEGEKVWRIRELLSGADLIAEGSVMKHCVASYARSCVAGHCSIWAMELHTEAGTEKHQTIEVTRAGVVVQCRGKQNRLPTPSELDIVKEWARYAGLTISPYVRAAA
jgi:PcfJ-like protein